MWYPKRTPASILTRMRAELEGARAARGGTPFDTIGVEPAPSTPAELEAYVVAETERWRKVIAPAGIRLE